MAKKTANTLPFWKTVFVLYLCLMAWLLFCRTSQWQPGLDYRQALRDNCNLKPFYTIDNYVYVLQHTQNAALYRHCLRNLLGNILLFLPAGWLLPRIFRGQRRFFPFFFTCALSVFLVEITQLFSLLGSLDIDDWILNMTGLLLGYILFHITKIH